MENQIIFNRKLLKITGVVSVILFSMLTLLSVSYFVYALFKGELSNIVFADIDIELFATFIVLLCEASSIFMFINYSKFNGNSGSMKIFLLSLPYLFGGLFLLLLEIMDNPIFILFFIIFIALFFVLLFSVNKNYVGLTEKENKKRLLIKWIGMLSIAFVFIDIITLLSFLNSFIVIGENGVGYFESLILTNSLPMFIIGNILILTAISVHAFCGVNFVKNQLKLCKAKLLKREKKFLILQIILITISIICITCLFLLFNFMVY